MVADIIHSYPLQTIENNQSVGLGSSKRQRFLARKVLIYINCGLSVERKNASRITTGGVS